MRFDSSSRLRSAGPVLLGSALIVLLITQTTPAHAQRPISAIQPNPTLAPENTLLPVPVLYYTPETSLAFGGSVSYFYRTDRTDPNSRASLLSTSATYTLESQILLSLDNEHYWDHDRNAMIFNAKYQKFGTKFFGLGNRTDADADETYTDEGSFFELEYVRVIWSHISVGAKGHFSTSSITDTEPGDLLESGAVPGAGGGIVVGAGLHGSYDTRDNFNSPLTGWYHQVFWNLNAKAFGSDFDYTISSFDFRRYVGVGRTRTVALRALGKIGGGGMPFQAMPALGGDRVSRGYFQGRFRDRKLAALQAEFRSPLFWRVGGVAFVGAGQVSHRIDELRIDDFHYNAGVGVRYALVKHERLNLRIDFGVGSDQTGFYAGVGETF